MEPLPKSHSISLVFQFGMLLDHSMIPFEVIPGNAGALPEVSSDTGSKVIQVITIPAIGF